MAVHNGERFLAPAIDSLLAQTLADFEAIIVDDGSDDRTAEILNDYAGRDDRLVVISNESQRGLPRSLNRGLRRCRAQIVARADADDLYEPNRLERQVQFLEAHPDIGVVSCGYHRIDEHGARLKTVVPTTGHRAIRIRMLFSNPLLHPGVAFRTSIVRNAGGYDPRYWTGQDADLWARLVHETQFVNLPDALVHHRIHADSIMLRRGIAGEALSVTVGHRMLHDYLGSMVDADDVRAMTAFYRGFRLSSREVERAMRGLHILLEQVRSREDRRTLIIHRVQVGRAVWRQAWIQSRFSGVLAARLFLEGLRWLPPRATVTTLAEAARTRLTPTGLDPLARSRWRSGTLSAHRPDAVVGHAGQGNAS